MNVNASYSTLAYAKVFSETQAGAKSNFANALGANDASQIAQTSNMDESAYLGSLKAKYGIITVKSVPHDQRSIDKAAKSMRAGEVVISPKILSQMASDPEKAAYFEGKLDYIFNEVIPRETANFASQGLTFSSLGVIIHDDGTITHICGCEDSPERAREVMEENRAKHAKRRAQAQSHYEQMREAAAHTAELAERRSERHKAANGDLANDFASRADERFKFETLAWTAKIVENNGLNLN